MVGAAEGRRLNRNFRGRDYATNVLTFAYADTQPLSGDIVLCAPVIAQEARAQGKALAAHYAHLVVHGVLHLQGYDHATHAQARAMEARETEIVTRLGYPDPYALSA
jgi:probable rRNA maturation factor